MIAFHRFQKSFSKAFQEAFPHDADVHDVFLLADFIMGDMFSSVDLKLHPASKREVFAEFIEPFDDEEFLEDEEPHTVEMAELGLALLVERQLVVVDGDQITLHPRVMEAVAIEMQETE
jgi:hypothetical protein